MKKVLRYVVELEYGDKQPASHQEACPFTQDPAQELEFHVGMLNLGLVQTGNGRSEGHT